MFFVYVKATAGRIEFAGYAGMQPGKGRAAFCEFAKREGYTLAAGTEERAELRNPVTCAAIIYIAAYSDEAQAAAAAGAINIATAAVFEHFEHYAEGEV